MIITSQTPPGAGNKVKTRSSQSWPGLAYEPSANKPITVPHQPGDILVLFVSDYNWGSWGTPTVGGPGAPVWNYIEGVAGAGGTFWARATSSSHTVGVIDAGGGAQGTWYATVAVFGGSGAANPIGGHAYRNVRSVVDAEVPAITLADSSGNSQIFSAFHGYGQHPTSGGAPGYTTLDYQAWTAPNGSVHGIGAFVKGDTTSDGAVIVAHTDNGWDYVNSCTVEIIGGDGPPTSTVGGDTIATDGSFTPSWTPPVQQPPPTEPPPVVNPPVDPNPTPTPITITSVTNAVGTTPLWSDPVWYINGSGLGSVNLVRVGFDTSSTWGDASILSVTDTRVSVQHGLPLTATSTSAALYANNFDSVSSGWFTFAVTPAPVDPGGGNTGGTPPPDVPGRLPHDPVTTEFGVGAAQVYTIPDWADAVDLIAIGGGGGGQGGGSLNSYGEHGDPGTWAGVSVLVDTVPDKRLYVTVGGGGEAGRGPLKDVGTDGHVSVVATTAQVTLVTGGGGLHGATGVLGGIADSPAVSSFTFNGVTYPGTPGITAADPAPLPSGHGVGGSGGVGHVAGGANGGSGGPGRVWIRAYQLAVPSMYAGNVAGPYNPAINAGFGGG